jgi:hypothetical protein
MPPDGEGAGTGEPMDHRACVDAAVTAIDSG